MAGGLIVYIKGVGYDLDPIITCQELYEKLDIDPVCDIYYQDIKIPRNDDMLADIGISNEVSMEVRKERYYAMNAELSASMSDGWPAYYYYIMLSGEYKNWDQICKYETFKECLECTENEQVR